jgi:hypothetical protein
MVLVMKQKTEHSLDYMVAMIGCCPMLSSEWYYAA